MIPGAGSTEARLGLLEVKAENSSALQNDLAERIYALEERNLQIDAARAGDVRDCGLFGVNGQVFLGFVVVSAVVYGALMFWAFH